MRAFLEEYGIAVFVIAVVAILIVMATPIGEAIQTSFTGVIGSFEQQAQEYITTIAPGAGGTGE